jgi:hypothetical protein
MKIKTEVFLKTMLGKDFFEVLKKSDVYKHGTKTVSSVEEISAGLKIVPRVVMSFLVSNLYGMKPADNKDLELPFAEKHKLHVVKHEQDVFSGYIYAEGKKINEFQNRTIPGIGLVLMTVFELYHLDESTKQIRNEEKEYFEIEKLKKLIDERLKLHSMVQQIVDQKLAQKELARMLIAQKIAHAIQVPTVPESKSEKLKRFLEERKNKQSFSVASDTEIFCHDCGEHLNKNEKNLSLCICYGEDWGLNLKINKSEKFNNVMFTEKINPENKLLLIQTLKKYR